MSRSEGLETSQVVFKHKDEILGQAECARVPEGGNSIDKCQQPVSCGPTGGSRTPGRYPCLRRCTVWRSRDGETPVNPAGIWSKRLLGGIWSFLETVSQHRNYGGYRNQFHFLWRAPRLRNQHSHGILDPSFPWAYTVAPGVSKHCCTCRCFGSFVVTMSQNSKKRPSTAGQYASVKVQLLAVRDELTVSVPSAWNAQQVLAHIKQEVNKRYPAGQYVTRRVKFPDGRFEHDSQLGSGLAFAQQQARVCLEPTATNQPTLMDQIDQRLAQQASQLEKTFNDRLNAQTEKQNAVTAFTAKPVLLRLASDILSLTLSAVRPDSKRGVTENIWDQPLKQHQDFADQLNKLCQRQSCPLSGSTIDVAFNGIRLTRNGTSNSGS